MSRRQSDEAKIRTLIPYGCTMLRMTELPLARPKQ